MNLPVISLLMYLVFSPMFFFPQDVLNQKTNPSVRHFRGSCAKWMKCRIAYVWPRCLSVVHWGKISERGWRRTTYHMFFLVPSQLPGIFTHVFFLLIISSLAFGSLVAYGCLVTRRIMLLRSPSSTHARRGCQRNCVCFGVSQFRKCSP